MPDLPLRDVMPYSSILMKVPEAWNEDPTAKELCYYYYKGNGGPPTFYVRRDDFIYAPGAAARDSGSAQAQAGASGSAAGGAAGAIPAIGSADLFGDIDEMDDALFGSFRQLANALNTPDVYYPRLEPRSAHGQLIRYLRHGMLRGQPGVAWWWVKGLRTGIHFTVASFCLELYASEFDSEESKLLHALFDREVCGAEILGLDEAVALHEQLDAEEPA